MRRARLITATVSRLLVELNRSPGRQFRESPKLGTAAPRADVGLLYDPGHAGERELSLRWQAALRARAPGWAIRRNYPYRGRSDGLTRYLRERFDPTAYTGIELEVNQKHVRNDDAIAARQRSAIALALRDALSAS